MMQGTAGRISAKLNEMVGSMTKSPTQSLAIQTFTTRGLPFVRRRSIRLLASVVILCAARSSNVYGVQPDALIGGIVSRSRAITSGRFTYTFKSQGFRGTRPLSPKVFPETTMSFFDSSWAERVKDSHLVRINHDGYFLEFVQTPQRDGSVRPGATLLPRRSLEGRMELNAPPIFAGSFWFREQLRYVEKHADEFRITGSNIVNTVPVVVLELAVAAENHRQAFHVVSPALKSGGTIRLFVAPQLGFVLPRVEFLTNSNEVAQSYDAVGFNEAAPGIYFPERLWTETHAAGGASRYRAEFITRCELINQSIPQEDFVVELPAGTRVQDAQEPGSVITFELTEMSSSSKLPTHGSISGLLWPPLRFLDRWGNAVIVGLVIGTVSSISLLLAARNQRYRGQSTR